MRRFLSLLSEISIVAATTIGAGMFALPYVFHRAGWELGLLFLLLLTIGVSVSHIIYWRVLESDGRRGLLGLVRESYPGFSSLLAFLGIVGGLLLTLVVYLILGAGFLELLGFRSPYVFSILIFWAASSFPIILGAKRLGAVEAFGTVAMVAIVFIIFLGGGAVTPASGINMIGSDVLLLFAGLLFSLAGWTAVEPVREIQKYLVCGRKVMFPWAGLVGGTALSAIVYVLFVLGIFSSTGTVTPDTLSGLTDWPGWKLSLLGVLGLFAIWTSYVPIGLEIRGAFERDLKWSPKTSLLLVLFIPLTLLALGLSDFTRAVGLAGGLFLALQYVFILLLGLKRTAMAVSLRLVSYVLLLVFSGVAVYEIYRFILD